MNTDENLRIVEFEEKPKHPKSTKASMGIYIFNKMVLKKYLIEDEADPESSKDFGKNIIPKMLADGCKMYAYPFSGYWKDVGTIQSLWEANMDLIGETPKFNLRDRSWRIFSRNYSDPPHFIGNYAKISNSLITEGCNIEGIVENSVLSSGVKVSRGAYIKDSVIMKNVTILHHRQRHRNRRRLCNRKNKKSEREDNRNRRRSEACTRNRRTRRRDGKRRMA